MTLFLQSLTPSWPPVAVPIVYPHGDRTVEVGSWGRLGVLPERLQAFGLSPRQSELPSLSWRAEKKKKTPLFMQEADSGPRFHHYRHCPHLQIAIKK
jgi:hypothetical protein